MLPGYIYSGSAIIAQELRGVWGETQVHGAGTRGVQTEELVEMSAVKDLVFCKKCGSGRVYRVYREGFMQERIYPHFGYYPWLCRDCGDHAMLRKRKRARTKD